MASGFRTGRTPVSRVRHERHGLARHRQLPRGSVRQQSAERIAGELVRPPGLHPSQNADHRRGDRFDRRQRRDVAVEAGYGESGARLPRAEAFGQVHERNGVAADAGEKEDRRTVAGRPERHDARHAVFLRIGERGGDGVDRRVVPKQRRRHVAAEPFGQPAGEADRGQRVDAVRVQRRGRIDRPRQYADGLGDLGDDPRADLGGRPHGRGVRHSDVHRDPLSKRRACRPRMRPASPSG